MSYCPKCGREIFDESLGCAVCSVRDNIDYSRSGQERMQELKAEPVTEFTVEDRDGTSQRFESRRETGGGYQYENQGAAPVEEKRIHPVLKVLIIVMIIMVGGIGALAGVAAGAALMKSPYEDYRRFGKTIAVVGGVMLAFSLLCCVAGGVVNTMSYQIIDMWD